MIIESPSATALLNSVVTVLYPQHASSSTFLTPALWLVSLGLGRSDDKTPQKKVEAAVRSSPNMSVQLSTTGIVILVFVLVPLYWVSKQTRLPLPPGPKGWPLIGNLLDVPQANFVATYTEWARKYGWLL